MRNGKVFKMTTPKELEEEMGNSYIKGKSLLLDIDSENVPPIEERGIITTKHNIKSFRLKYRVSSHQIEKAKEIFVDAGFVSSSTSKIRIEKLFKYQDMSTSKINWIGDLTSLYTFIKILNRSGIILDTKNNHWKITSACFLLKDEGLTPSALLNQKESESNTIKEAINSFINLLKGDENTLLGEKTLKDCTWS